MKITVNSLYAGGSISIQDNKYNPCKVWRISKDKSNHYYLEQFISGNRIGKKTRLTLKYINSVIG